MIKTGDHMTVDLAVTMPSRIFQEKDYLNYRYFHKRAYYLACVATGIKEAEGNTFPIDFSMQNDNELQPTIVIGSGQGTDDFSKSKCDIRIILAAEEDLFPVSKTLPHKNAIRSKVKGESLEPLPTPYYNASIRSECTSLQYLKYLNRTSAQSDQFTDACILGNVWIRQRGLSRGGFGSFEWAAMIALLMDGGGHSGQSVLSRRYSSYQLFKATLQYLATKNLATNPVFLQAEESETFRSEHPVFFDGTRGLDILFKMTPWSYALLRHEAIRTLETLRDPNSDHFDACFIDKVDDPMLRFDCVIQLPRRSDTASDDASCLQQLYDILKVGLNDRTHLLYLEGSAELSWQSSVHKLGKTRQDSINIGLLLNPEQAARTVDRGPSAEDKEAAASFRHFWGEKAELRRFKDGSIQESLIWSNPDTQNSIVSQIITFIVRRHLSNEIANGLVFRGVSFESMLPAYRGALCDPGGLYQGLMTSFETLEKDLRKLDGIPLQIRQVSATDSQLRYASIKPPILDPNQCAMDPAGVCMQFEGSSRWPDNLPAVQRTKVAFLLKVGELLEECINGISAQVGLENSDKNLLNHAFLDIHYSSGALFRLRIHHDRELNFLERALKGEAQATGSREEIAFALSSYKRDFVQSPLHTQAVRTLSTRFPLLSTSMRLMKRWRNSHLLSGQISDELIELLTIRVFVHPCHWSVPGSGMAGFLRTLSLIAKWDWRTEPLIVNFNGEMETQDLDAIRLRFEAWRKIDPAMNRVAMFVASNIDRDGITWTELGPSKVVAARFTSLAKTACQLVKVQGMKLDPEALFVASLGDYDFVIHLNPKFSGAEERKSPGFKNLRVHAPNDNSLCHFYPVKSYLAELRRLHDSNILFFYGEHEGPVIAGLWNPQTGPRPWKVNLQYSFIPSSPSESDQGASRVMMNRIAILNDITRLGADMVVRIDINSKESNIGHT